MDTSRPARTLNLSAKLKDVANTETPQLSFQRKAVHDFHSRQAEKSTPSSTAGTDPSAPSASSVSTPQNTCRISLVADSDSDDEVGIVGQPTASCKSSSCPKIISHFGAFFTAATAKARCAIVTMSQAKRRRAVTVDEVDTTDAEGDIRDKGTVF